MARESGGRRLTATGRTPVAAGAEGSGESASPDSPVYLHTWELSVDAQAGARLEIGHRRYPGLRFTVSISPSGVPVGFAIEPAGDIEEYRRYLQVGRPMAQRWKVPEGPALTARTLRQIPLGEIQREAERLYRERLSSIKVGAMGHDATRWLKAFRDTPRPGRRGREDRAYAALASAYVGHLGAGRAVALLATELSYSPSRVRNLIYEARRRGLLTAPPRGREGGQLTAKALELLSGEESEHRTAATPVKE